jgi:non-ribosomal peptide synthetase component E (peptide arylation enzyme)
VAQYFSVISKLQKIRSFFHLPEGVEVIEEMPLTNVGKVDKIRLKEEIKEKLRKESEI